MWLVASISSVSESLVIYIQAAWMQQKTWNINKDLIRSELTKGLVLAVKLVMTQKVKSDIQQVLPVDTDDSKLSIWDIGKDVPDESLYLAPVSMSSYR